MNERLVVYYQPDVGRLAAFEREEHQIARLELLPVDTRASPRLLGYRSWDIDEMFEEDVPDETAAVKAGAWLGAACPVWRFE